MDHECQLAFLNWVAYHPTSNDGKPYSHLSCPLSGCERTDLKDFASYLQHVADCPFLPSATYRCPHCNRDECFAASTLQYEKKTKDQKDGKDSKVRDAVVSFFKHFGRKKDLNLIQELQADAPFPKNRLELQAAGFIDDKPAIDWPCKPQVGYLGSTLELGPTPEICTMNHRGSYIPILGELPTPCQPSELLGGVSFGPGLEMSGTRSYIHRSDRSDSDNHSIPTRHASTSSQLSEQWSGKDQESPHSAMMSPEPLRYYGSKSHSYHQHCTSNDSVTDMEYCDSEQHWGKIPGTSQVLSPKDTSLPSELESSMLREQSDYDSMTPRSRLGLRLNIPQMVPGMTELLPLNSEAVPSPSAVILHRQEVGRSLPLRDDKQNFVKELFQISHGLEYLWARKLKASPELSSKTFHLHSAPALQGGLGVLKQLFESNIDVPRTMEQLYQFMHIAFACAYKAYTADSWYPWKAFYEDVLRWSQIIAEPEDRDLYLQVADLIWSAPENLAHSMNVCICPDPESSPSTVNFGSGFASHNPGTDGTLSTGRQRPIPFEQAFDRLVVLEQLKKGVVVKSCARYLDGT